jgi:hypothetical protein
MPARLTHSRARPVRVAYFVEDNAHADITLDAIFARSFGHWGGRFSLIVPCLNDRPKPAYDKWLERYDPDIIYSYVPLEDELLERLHERLYPSFLISHQVFGLHEVNAYTLKPRLPIDPLSISTLIPLAAGPIRFEPAQPTCIVDTMGRASTNRFIQDSFGSWLGSVGSSYPASLREYGSLLTVVEDDEAQPRAAYFRPPDRTINTAIALLTSLRQGRVSTASCLSAMSTSRLEFNNSRWGDAFNIVVGDSFGDRLIYWNARAHFRKWRDASFVDLRVPYASLDDAALVSCIGEFLQARNTVSPGSSGPPQAVIGSLTVSVERLTQFAETLRAASRGLMYSVQMATSEDDCIPTTEELEHSDFTMADSYHPRASSLWSETTFQDRDIRITPPAPDHLRFAPAALQNPYHGTWAVDLQIEREVNYSQLHNVQQKWNLPRRLRMTAAFVKGYEIQSSFGQFMIPRVSKGGLLTLFANSGSKFPIVRQPEDELAFRTAFLEGHDWYPFRRGPREQSPTQLCKGISRSENGRYVWGVLQMFPSLNEANGVLLHQFWREQFSKLGASSAASDARLEVVERTLVKRFRNNVLDIRDRDELKRITKIVLQEAEHYRTFIPSLSWAELESAFRDFQDRQWRAQPAEYGVDEAEWRRLELSRFTDNVRELCQRDILHQGFENKCTKCLHRSWIAIDGVKREIRCEVCGTAEAAPVNRPWEFRLNEFVREALRKHGVLPIFWALSRLRNLREESFFFEGPLDIFFDQLPWEADGPDTDLDLVCVLDGRVSICEVKQSARQLRKARDFSTTIRRLRPDVGVIAVMEPETPEIRQSFNQFAQELRDSGIEASLLTLGTDDFSDRI